MFELQEEHQLITGTMDNKETFGATTKAKIATMTEKVILHILLTRITGIITR